MQPEEILERNLDRQHSMVRFLEQKNGALLAVSSAMFAIAIGQFFQLDDFPHKNWMWLPIACLYVTMFMTAASFFPYSESPSDSFRGENSPNGFSFFGDLKDMSAAEIRRIADQNTSGGAFAHDLSRQIKLNAVICARKVAYFNRGLFFFLCALLTPPVAIPAYLFLRAGKWNFAAKHVEKRKTH